MHADAGNGHRYTIRFQVQKSGRGATCVISCALQKSPRQTPLGVLSHVTSCNTTQSSFHSRRASSVSHSTLHNKNLTTTDAHGMRNGAGHSSPFFFFAPVLLCRGIHSSLVSSVCLRCVSLLLARLLHIRSLSCASLSFSSFSPCVIYSYFGKMI
jgi:hypothetical protein